jgi:Zn-dependent metalloprotease
MKQIISTLTFLCCISILNAQDEPTAVKDGNQKIKNLTTRVNKAGWLYFKNGIKLKHNELFSDNMKDAFGLTKHDEMKLTKEERDESNRGHQRLKQYFKGVKVEGGDYILHYDPNGNLTHSNGKIQENIDKSLNVNPNIQETKALNLAIKALGNLKMAWNSAIWEQKLRIERSDSFATYKPKGELTIIKSQVDKKYKLAYLFNVLTIEQMNYWQVYIDASNGDVLLKRNNIKSCSPRTISFTSLYNGNQTTIGVRAGWFSPWVGLESCASNINIETLDNHADVIVNNSTDWGTYHQQFTSAHWALQKSWEYFRDVFNRTGWNGNCEKAQVLVNNISSDLPTFLIPPFPDNFGIDFIGNIQVGQHGMSLDVIGHEFTHGVDYRTAELNTSGEAGALSESFGDIFGEVIERNVTGSTDFITGSGIPWNLISHTNFNTARRNLVSPASSCCSPFQGPNASTFGPADPNWIDPNSGFDDGGIHFNCGVQNRWFTLLSNGGTQNGITVQPIGIDKAAKIAYLNLRFQLFPSATFQDAANGSTQIAENLFGCNSFELEQTIRAWQAVGLNAPNPNIMLFGSPTVCTYSSSTQVTAIEACWRNGANFTWSITSPSNTVYNYVIYNPGNKTFSLEIPPYSTPETVKITVTGTLNGAVQVSSFEVSIIECEYNLRKPGNNNAGASQIALSPNPASEFVNLFLPKELIFEQLEIEVYNMVGQKLKEINASGTNNKIDVANLQIGMYHLVVRDRNKTMLFSKKFIKI